MNVSTGMTRPLVFLSLLSLFSLLHSCRPDEADLPTARNLAMNESARVPMAWMDLFLDIDRYCYNFRPGPSPRVLAYTNLAAYEAVVQGMPSYQSLSHLYPGLALPAPVAEESYHWPTVVNAVYANLFQKMIPGHIMDDLQRTTLQFRILGLEQGLYDEFVNLTGRRTQNLSKEYGNAVAEAFWTWSMTDSYGHDGVNRPRPADYVPPAGPGMWQPTPPDFGAALFPYWGKARSFVLAQEDKLSRPPVTFSEDPGSSFYAQALEVRNIVENLDFTNQWIAEFWSDDYIGLTFSPPARWLSITTQVLEREGSSLEMALYTYAKVSVSLNDAAVACWHSKYTYNLERPVTYINRVMDPDWAPHWDSSPSFPAFPSGHSTFGAAAAEVLSHIFGYNYAMTDTSHGERDDFYGMPRTFDTFYEMAEENAYSRIPLGVHFRMDAEEGVRLGFAVGRKVNQMPFKK
jgi:hypothetical protein